MTEETKGHICHSGASAWGLFCLGSSENRGQAPSALDTFSSSPFLLPFKDMRGERVAEKIGLKCASLVQIQN